jgi:hypothetical protein
VRIGNRLFVKSIASPHAINEHGRLRQRGDGRVVVPPTPLGAKDGRRQPANNRLEVSPSIVEGGMAGVGAQTRLFWLAE